MPRDNRPDKGDAGRRINRGVKDFNYVDIDGTFFRSALFSKPKEGYIYLDDESQAERVLEALYKVAEAYGWHIVEDGPPVIGSFKQRLKIWFHRGRESQTGQVLQADLKRAAQLRMVDELQSKVDLNHAQAASALIESLKEVQNAAIALGSTLLLKVDGSVIVRNLSPKELDLIRSSPTILDTPALCLQMLQALNAPAPVNLGEVPAARFKERPRINHKFPPHIDHSDQ